MSHLVVELGPTLKAKSQSLARISQLNFADKA